MPTQILAAGTNEADSTEVVVAAGTPKNIGAFRNDEETLELRFRGLIYRKDPNGDLNPTLFLLAPHEPNVVITGAGTYVVRRMAGIEHSTGIQVD